MSRRNIESTGLIRSRDEYDGIPSADYEALRSGPLVRQRNGLAPLGSGADWHLRFEIQHLRFGELARDVRRNDPFVGQGVSRLLDNVLQGGPTVDPCTGNTDVNNILKEGWEKWCSDKMLCHALQTMNWAQMRRVSMDDMITVGDIFTVMVNDDSADLMEAHRARKPQNTVKNVVFGILKDDRGRPQQVWFTKENIQPAMQLNNVGATRPTPIRDEDGFEQVMHLIDRQRATQTRGVTKFAPIFKPITLIDDTVYAQLVKEQIQSCFVILRERPQTDGNGPTQLGTAGNASIKDDGPSQRLLQEIFPGMESRGNPGETLKAFTPQVAGADFINFSMVILGMLAVNLDMPLAVFLLDASKGNFANMRGVIMQARLAWQRLQRLQIDCQERPAYLWRVRSMIFERSRRGDQLRKLLGLTWSRLSSPQWMKDLEFADVNPFKHHWHLPEWEYIDPLKDISAGALELSSGQSSPRRVANRQQVAWSALSSEIVEDRGILAEKAILKAIELNTKYPDLSGMGGAVDWHLFYPVAMSQGVTTQITPTSEPDGDETPSKTSTTKKKEPADAD